MTGLIAIPRPVAAAKLIALTFDDGPGPYTEELLDALAQRNVKATFFLVGTCVQRYPELVKREYDEGHQLANHSWDHAKLSALDDGAFSEQLSKTDDAIDAAIGDDIGKLVLRPPYGSITAAQKSMAGRPIILWSVDPLDWKYRDAETVKNNIVEAATEGAIILVHDIHATSVTGSIAAIDELEAQGYTFVTVSELFRRKGIALDDGGTYTNAPADGVDSGPKDPYAYDESRLSEHWAYPYIQYVRENELMNGIKDDKFGPEYPMTRAMFVATLLRMAAIDEQLLGLKVGKNGAAVKDALHSRDGTAAKFSDVKDDAWYKDAVNWAVTAGITQGTGKKTFSPDAEVSREQAAVMLANYLTYTGLHVGELPQSEYSDGGEIHEWAEEAVAIVTKKGLMNGVGNGAFGPAEMTTRAQCAVMLTKLHKIQKLRLESRLIIMNLSIKDLYEKTREKTS